MEKICINYILKSISVLILYSPAFAFCFGCLALLPDFIGLNAWNLLNALVLLIAFYSLPKTSVKVKGLMLLLILIDLKTTLHMAQSNALVAGLIILTFCLLERNNFLLAALCIVSSVYIKVFGIVGIVLFLFYPEKWKLALYTLLWMIVFLISPLVIVSFSHLKDLYIAWFSTTANNLTAISGVSIMGLLKSWFNRDFSNSLVTLIGANIVFNPFLKI